MVNNCEICDIKFDSGNPCCHVGNYVICKSCKMKLGNKSVDEYIAEIEQAKLDAEEAKKSAKEAEKVEQEEAEKKAVALPKILITSGFNFDGYKITKYSGYISGDDCVELERSVSFLGARLSKSSNNLTDALVKIRRNALQELKEAAYDLGCNAVIGVDFDYMTLDPETTNLTGQRVLEPYMICVTANGNAVVIEKTDD